MRLSDAGIRRRQTKALDPNHRLPPGLTEDATRDRSIYRLLDAAGRNRGIVFDNRERIVESVQKFLPALIPRRFSEANRVVLKATPTDEKNVSVLNFKATTKLMRNIPRGR
jgi:hypothetical protein